MKEAEYNPFLQWFLYAATFKVLAMPVYVAVCRYIDEFYASGDCLLSMVKETNPEHFANMAYWSVLEFNDCPDLAWFYHNKNRSFDIERQTAPILISLTGLGLLYCCYSFILGNRRQELWNWRIPFYVAFVLYGGIAFLLGWTHLEGDILYFLGNVSHHSDPAILGFGEDKNMIGVGDGGEKTHLFDGNFGAFWTTAASVFFLLCHLGQKYFKCSFHLTAIVTAVSVIGFIALIGVWHDDWHVNATEEWGKSFPMSYKWMAHHHVFGHHSHGFDVLQAWPHDELFNPFLHAFTSIVANLYGGDIHHWLHVPCAVAMDAVFGIFMYVFMVAYANIFDYAFLKPTQMLLNQCGLCKEEKVKGQ